MFIYFVKVVLNIGIIQAICNILRKIPFVRRYVIKDEDVLNMPIPILGDDIKQDVVAKVNESASLRRQSKQLLEYAKQAVEMAIEQGEDAALVWLKERSGE